MGNTNLAPVPTQTPITAQSMLTIPWQSWFIQLYTLVLAASQIDATAAAAAAASSATAAASASTSASGYSTSALGYSNSAATSASIATTAAGQANGSAASAAASAAAAEAAATSQSFAPYNISSTITVPVNTQMVTFQRVSLLAGGRLVIKGRGRIL